ncbi:hypothetical protein D9M71_715640 [compost metagenome]
MINGFRTGGQSALQLGKSEADVAFSLAIKALSQIHLIANVLGYMMIELCFKIRELIIGCVGTALGKQLSAIEFEQLFLDHTTHQVGDIDLVCTLAEFAIEAVPIKQRQPNLEVFFLTIVRSGRHQ